MDHVAFIRPEPLDALYNGTKEWEIRLSKLKHLIPPVSVGDRCLIKRSGGEVEAVCEIIDTATFSALTPEEVGILQDEFGSHLDFESEYWEMHREADHACLIKFGDFIPASLPDSLTPHGVRLGWVSGFDHFEEARLSRQSDMHPLGSGRPEIRTRP